MGIKWDQAKWRKVPKVGSLKCLKFGKLNHLTPRLRSATDGEDFKRNGTVGTSNNVKLMMENVKCKTLLFFIFHAK